MLPSKLLLSPTKDAGERIFKGAPRLRWLFRFYTQRLTRAGRWFLWPTAIFMAYGGASLQMQGYVPFSYAVGLWLVGLIVMLLIRPRVLLKAQHVDRVCAGELLPVDIEIEQLARFSVPEMVVLPHRLPMEIDAEPPDGTVLTPPQRGQKARLRLHLRCKQRGVYTLHGYRVESDFPIGLFNATRRFEQDRALMVYPRFTRLGRLDLPTGRRYHPGGVALASSLGESFEYIGNREYREGDSIRDIDWRATARLCQPIVREYRDEYYLRVAVILDTHVAKKARPAEREAFERAVSLAAAVSDYMARQEYLVDIFAAGPNLYHLTAGRSLAYLDQILDILACVGESEAEPFGVLEPEIMEGLAKITTVICVFLDWNEARRSFVQHLVSNGAGVKVIVVRDGACTLDVSAGAEEIGRIAVLSSADVEKGVEEV